MASESCAANGVQQKDQDAMAMFRAGRSKADIARDLDMDKKAVGKMIARAMRAKEDSHGSAR